MCKFCNNENDTIIENETCFIVKYDKPSSYGHAIIIPKSHKKSFFDLTYKELEDIHMLAKNYRSYLDKSLKPDGYNLGFNDGGWAGQEDESIWMHIIPRYAGDVSATELKGGICNIKGIRGGFNE